jgi:hypothetical protein
MQRYEPNCKRNVKIVTNHLKIEITDETGIVVNFRGKSVIMHFSFDVFLILNE